jgi:hypothetical protein
MPISETMSNGRRGQIASTDVETDTLLADVAQIAGVGVCPGATGDKHGKVPASAADVGKLIGVAAYMPSRPVVDGTNEWAADDEMTLVTRGKVFVVTEEAVAKGDPVYCRHTAKSPNTQLGAFRNDADPGAATDAVLGLTETDANVENGTFVVTLEDTSDGAIYQASFTSSTTSHADAATGIAAAIDAVAPTTSTPGSEAADKIDIAIVHATSTAAVRILNVESVGASALSIETQGAAGDTCSLVANAKFDETTSASGVAKAKLTMPQ